jgi:hydrogenase maturation factor
LSVGIKTAGGVIGYGFTTLNFIGSGNTFATSGNTVDISIAGGGGGGGSELDTSVNGTTAVGVGSIAVATHRSASIRVQIDQGANYQVGRYLMIHDGTTVTVVEEAAVATGSMLGSLNGDINNSNAELKVTMVSSGIATVTTIIDKITI